MVSTFFFNTQFTLERFPYWWRLQNLRKGLVQPHIHVHFENQTYEVKTVNCPSELAQVLQLRFEVFFNEFSTKRPWKVLPYDVDLHDFYCDHLVVKNKEDGRIVACYRLLSSELMEKAGHYYSQSEFELDEFLKLPGKKLELGRACVHKDFRNGAVVSLLWKGLCEYAKKSGVRYMFGCSSINRKDFDNVPLINAYLKKKDVFITDYEVKVKKAYQHYFQFPDCEEDTGAAKVMNSLMNMYILAGAKLGEHYAYDREMDCLDMFTVLDFTKFPESFKRRFA